MIECLVCKVPMIEFKQYSYCPKCFFKAWKKRVKSERELKWEKENAEGISKDKILMKERLQKDWLGMKTENEESEKKWVNKYGKNKQE